MTESLSKDMRYDVLDLPKDDRGNDIDILDAFKKELRAIEAFNNYQGEMKAMGLNRNKLIAYIILVYSHDSFLHQGKYKFEDFKKRLIIAADLVGLDRVVKRGTKKFGKISGEEKVFDFQKDVDERLFELYDEEFALMILEYLKFQSQSEWSEWCILNHELMENYKIRLAPIKEDKDKDQIAAQEKKAKFREQSEQIRESIKTYELKIFGDNERLRQVKSAQKYLTIEKIVKGEIVI